MENTTSYGLTAFYLPSFRQRSRLYFPLRTEHLFSFGKKK